MSAEPSLLERLEDPDESVRAFAAEDAGFDGRAEDVPALVDRLRREGSRFVREAIVTALSRVGHEAVGDQAVALLGSDDAFVRNAGVSLLQSGGRAAIARLLPAFDGADADTRKLMLDAASGVPGEEAEQVLLRGLSDPDINVRIAAVEYLGDRSHSDLKGHFEALVRTEREPMLLAAALSALEAVGDEETWRTIDERSRSGDPFPAFLSPQVLRVMARCGGGGCLERLFAERPRSGPAALADWIDALEIFHERHAFRAVSGEQFKALCDVLGSAPSSMSRFRLLKWMGKLDEQPGVVGELTGSLDSPDRMVRHGAALGLALLGTGDAVAALSIRLPAERDGQVREAIEEGVLSARGARP